MRKVLFVTPSFDIGGTTTSLVNLLPLLPKDKFNIDIFPINNIGEAGDILSKYAHLLVPHTTKADSHKQKGKKIVYNSLVFIAKKVKRFLSYLGIDISPLFFKKTAKKLQKGNYDIVVAFQEGYPTSLVKYIHSPFKIAWVHSMFSRFSASKNLSLLINDYDCFDKIVCVSNVASADMKKSVPSLSGKIYTVYNGLNIEWIINKSNDFVIDNDTFTLISIGRIDPVKRFSEIPHIASKIRDKGVKFNWIIIGGKADAKESLLLKNNIVKFSVQDCVRWLGKKNNPYPFLKSSDLLVCLSSSETFNYTLAEARALNVPIITTDFPAASEFVVNNETGIIKSIEFISDAIYELISNKNLYNQIKEGARQMPDWNKRVILQINHIFNL